MSPVGEFVQLIQLVRLSHLEDGVPWVGGVEGVAGGVQGQGGLHRPGPHHLHQGSGVQVQRGAEGCKGERCRSAEV